MYTYFPPSTEKGVRMTDTQNSMFSYVNHFPSSLLFLPSVLSHKYLRCSCSQLHRYYGYPSNLPISHISDSSLDVYSDCGFHKTARYCTPPLYIPQNTKEKGPDFQDNLYLKHRYTYMFTFLQMPTVKTIFNVVLFE